MGPIELEAPSGLPANDSHSPFPPASAKEALPQKTSDGRGPALAVVGLLLVMAVCFESPFKDIFDRS